MTFCRNFNQNVFSCLIHSLLGHTMFISRLLAIYRLYTPTPFQIFNVILISAIDNIPQYIFKDICSQMFVETIYTLYVIYSRGRSASLLIRLNWPQTERFFPLPKSVRCAPRPITSKNVSRQFDKRQSASLSKHQIPSQKGQFVSLYNNLYRFIVVSY